MHQYNIHKTKTTAKADKPAVKIDFTSKSGNSNGCGCGSLITLIILYIIFTIMMKGC